MSREAQLIDGAIKAFDLNLDSFVVFTEAASGHFQWTPLIALRSGAERVFALAKSSRFGTAEKIASDLKALAGDLGVEERLTVVFDAEEIGKADIITNTGFVRPLSSAVIDRLKSQATIPLMWETWEFRPEDLDLTRCFQRGILVLGTNESHPALNFHRYVGLLGVKLLLEVDVELVRSKILVIGNSPFGNSVAEALRAAGAEVALVSEESDSVGRIGSKLSDGPAYRFLQQADALVFAEHRSERMLVGSGGDLTPSELADCNRDVRIAHISGLIDATALAALDFRMIPESIASLPRTMSVTAGYLGPRPVIELHAAGLRVGQEMARARRRFDPESALLAALENPLCQDFSPEQKRLFGAG
jgi:hypothetical protein